MEGVELNQPRPRVHAHRVQRRAHRFRRAIDRAADAAIGIACPHHQRSEVQRLLGHRRGFHLRDPLGSPALVVQRGILFHQRRVRRIDKLHALRRVRRPGADQHGFDHAFPRQARRRLQHARVRAFGERDRLFQLAGPLDEPGHEELCRFRNRCHLPES